MAKNAYLVVSDLHDSCKNPENRKDYEAEINVVKEKILEIALKYKERGCELTLLLLGDVYHRSYQNVINAILTNNFWIAASKVFKNIYTVLGNHETTYYSNNPFFTLIKSVESLKVQSLNRKNWQPLGIFNVFEIVDYVEDGNVVFHFNHNACPVTIPEKGRTNIGLFHTDFVFSEIAKASEDANHMNAWISNTISAENNELLDTYDYCFFGHHHKLYGCWNVENDNGHNCVIYHLASLGRPNVSEVDDSFLERNIPVILVEDGKLSNIENNFFNLLDRFTCVKEDVVAVNKQLYERTKSLQKIKNYVPIDDNPVENIRMVCLNDEYLSNVFNGLIDNTVDDLTQELFTDIEKELR